MKEELVLINPSKEYEKDLLDYMDELYETDSTFDGCGMLENYLDNFDGWLGKLEELKKLGSTGRWVQSDTFMLVRKNDNKIVGLINVRYYLNEFLFNYGGNIGYNIRPSERRKGYNLYQLKLVLELCKNRGMDKVLITCNKENTASRKSIIKSGGILENELVDVDGVVIDKGKTLQRYWIKL